MTATSRGFGVTAGLDPEIATPLATRCEELGYGSVWSSDTPIAEGLETVAAFAEGTSTVDLGLAVLAIDRHSPDEIATRIEELDLPRERLWLGVGAGTTKKPLTEMREHLPALREAVGGVRLILAAMGPKMCALGGAKFDGVFLNWVTPDFAAGARKHVERGAREAGRDTPPVMAYVRTAIGDDAEARLTKEESFYRKLHDGYRNHFDRLNEEVGTVGIADPDPASAQRRLDAFDALDITVVRALASANLEAMSTLAENAAP